MPATSSFRATTMPQSLLLPSSLTKRRRHAPPYCSATSSRADRKASFALNQGHVSSFKNSPELRIYSSNNGRKPSKPTKLRVAVDVDEVLGRFVHSLNAFCMEEYGLEYQVSDYHIYDFAKVWRCSQDESNHKVHEFFKSYHFSAGIEVIPGAFEALLRLRSECELVVVTSRQHVIQEPTMEWLNTHFPSIFEAVHFGNHFALEGKSRKKSEICHAIGAHVLIDDNPNYAMECAAAGINVLLYDWEHSYPWSKTPDGPVHERITRVRDWDEVEQVLGILSSMSTTNGASSSAAAADVFEVPPCSSSASALLPPSSSSS